MTTGPHFFFHKLFNFFAVRSVDELPVLDNLGLGEIICGLVDSECFAGDDVDVETFISLPWTRENKMAPEQKKQ